MSVDSYPECGILFPAGTDLLTITQCLALVRMWSVFSGRCMRNWLFRRNSPQNLHLACKFYCRKLPVNIWGNGREDNLLVWQQGKYFFCFLKRKKIHKFKFGKR